MTTDMTELLSSEETKQFLVDILQIPDYEKQFKDDKYKLLCNIIVRYQAEIPFQCIDLLAVPLESRQKPTIKSVKERLFSKVGGLCYANNTFIWMLLKAIGYDVRLIMSSVSQPDNHILVIVRDLVKIGDCYLIDVGCGYPSFEPISLDFEKESPMYQHSFLTYKFVRVGDRFLRLHRHGDLRPVDPSVPKSDFVDGCRRFYDFELEERDLASFDKDMDDVYRNPARVPFHTSMRAIIFRDQKAVALKDTLLLEEDPNTHKLVPTKMNSCEEVKANILKKFPVFTTDIVDGTLKTLKELQILKE